MSSRLLLTTCSLALTVASLGGCASGRPLSELIPDEHHLRACAAASTGEYSPAEQTGIDQQDLTWAPVGLDDESRHAMLRYEARSVVRPSDMKPAATYELGAEVTGPAGLRSVSVALLHLEPVARQPGHAQLEAIIANFDRVPPVIAAALREQPYAVADLRRDPDGVLRHVFAVPAADLRWGPQWFGRAADVLLSIVMIDEVGRVRRTVLGAGVGVVEEDAAAAPR